VPELPEVQTMSDDLNKKVIGKTIADFGSEWKRRVRPNFTQFRRRIVGRKIIKTKRIGKCIVAELDSKDAVVMHMKMTGHLLFKSEGKNVAENEFFWEKVNGYVRHWFVFKDKSRLEFSDLRKFGWLNVVAKEEVGKMKEISQLGIDALDKRLDYKKFNQLLSQKPKGVIGTVLLDQKWISGIGNIYRSEILFGAKIIPNRAVKSLTSKEKKDLFKKTRKILKKAVKMRGTSDSDYRDTFGKKGTFQNVLKVYRREGQKCQRKGCKGTIKREKIAQRSAFFCSKCQK
jgi:formamidopyrimidine-DNA glycosylase